MSRATQPSNPAWSYDEAVLALACYLQLKASRELIGIEHPLVVRLSDELRQRAGLQARLSRSFRNPSGVTRHLRAFDHLDRGKQAPVAAVLRRVWRDYVDGIIDPAARAEVIRGTRPVVAGATPVEELATQDESEETWPEGAAVQRTHMIRERDRRRARLAKERYQKKHGCLRCEACGFCFEDCYGPAGAGLIECHHDRPLASLQPGEKVNSRDLRLLCANCHRLIHHRRPWLRVSELKALLHARSGPTALWLTTNRAISRVWL